MLRPKWSILPVRAGLFARHWLCYFRMSYSRAFAWFVLLRAEYPWQLGLLIESEHFYIFLVHFDPPHSSFIG